MRIAVPDFVSSTIIPLVVAVKGRLPVTYSRPEYVKVGGLMTYGQSVNDLFRRAATYVDCTASGRVGHKRRKS